MSASLILPSRFSSPYGRYIWEKLRCPCCLEKGIDSGHLIWDGAQLTCKYCREIYPVVDGIPVMLVDASERQAKEQFSESLFYERMFAAGEYSARDLSDHVMRILDVLARYVPGSPAVLEVGSGRGQLQSLFEKYLALDYSLVALKSYITGPAICANAELLPLAENSFDLVITIATLEHVWATERAFAELARVVAPGGILYLAPAWHVRPWAASGIPVRSYRDLPLRQKILKALLPILDSIVWQGLWRMPWRIARRLHWVLRRKPMKLKYKRLFPNYSTYWMSDSDATSSLDCHEGILYFESRGWQILSHKTVMQRLLARHDVVLVRKPL